MGIIYLKEEYNECEGAIITGLSNARFSYFASNTNCVTFRNNSIFLRGEQIIDLVHRFYNHPNFNSRRRIDVTRWALSTNDQLALEIVGNNFPVKAASIDDFLSFKHILNEFVKSIDMSAASVKRTLESLAEEIIYGPGEQVPYCLRNSIILYSAQDFRRFVESQKIFCGTSFWTRNQITNYINQKTGQQISHNRVKALIEYIAQINSQLPKDQRIPIIIKSRNGGTLYKPNPRFLQAIIEANKEYRPRKMQIKLVKTKY